MKMKSSLRIKRAIKSLFNLMPAGRNLSVFEDDVYIVSYPKSGNTWTRFLIANLIYGKNHDVDFKNIEKLVPDIYQNNDDQLLKCKRPRYLKSHEYYDPRYRKIIYIVRDPRDVLVSNYYFLIKTGRINQTKKIEEFASDFIYGTYNPYGNWSENAASWVSLKKKDILVLKYEDMILETERSLLNIVDYLELNMTNEHIYATVKNSTFEKMKYLESRQSDEWKPLKGTRKDIPFMRKGKSGEWRGELSDDIVERIKNEWGDEMKMFGYE